MTKPDYKEDEASERDTGTDKPGRSSSRLRRVQSTSGGKRGRRPSRVDRDAKLERSRQSARECRARKKQKYHLLEATVTEKEKQILSLREKLEKYKNFCQKMDDEEMPSNLLKSLEEDEAEDAEEDDPEIPHPGPSASISRHRTVSLGGGDSSSDDDSD